MQPGPRNLLTDVPGLLVGHAQDLGAGTGVTVVTARRRLSAAVHLMGSAPGTRETDTLAPHVPDRGVDAVVLSGGSAFGLDAASGVAAALGAAGRGFAVAGHHVPIVPAAILFDLTGRDAPAAGLHRRLGEAALADAAEAFALGTEGAGTGATVAGLKGGLGSASLRLASGATVAALAAVNAIGSVTVGDGPWFWAAPFEIGSEFGGLGAAPPGLPPLRTKLGGAATTLAVVATDAPLPRPALHRLAVTAEDGMARAILPCHTEADGDIVFALTTNEGAETSGIELGHAAALCLARAIARGVYAARSAPGDRLPTWRDRFG